MWNKLKYGLPPFIFAIFTAIFYGPISIYLNNTDDLWFSFGTALRFIVPISLGLLFLALLLVLLLPKKASEFLATLVLGGALGMYIQGAINIEYGNGVLDGSAIDWSQYTTYAVIDSLVWLACILLPFLLLWKLKDKARKILPLLALFLTVIQVPALLIQLANYDAKSNIKISVSNEGEYELGSEKNIVIFVLDTMDQDYYQEFITAHPEYKESFEDFTAYTNNMASGARTIIGMPSLLTGQPFMNQSGYTEYTRTIWSQANFMKEAHDQGYATGIYSDPDYYSAVTASYVDNLKDNESASSRKTYRILAVKMYKLMGYIYGPHVLKPRFLINTIEFADAKENSEEYVINDSVFFDGFQEKDNSFTIVEGGKAVRVYHLMGAHPGYSMLANGERSTSYTDCPTQVQGSYYIVSQMIEAMKKQGVYDKSTIIITADHGDNNLGADSDKCEYAALMIKRANEKHPYEESVLPTSAFDVPVLLFEELGKTMPASVNQYGMSFDELTETTERTRHFFYNNRESSARTLVDEYTTTEDLRQHPVLTLYESHELNVVLENYVFGTPLSFELEATANNYCVDGISSTTGWNSIVYGPRFAMKLPLASIPEEGSLHVSMKFGTAKYLCEGAKYQIFINRNMVYEGTLSQSMGEKTLEFDVPVDEIFEHVMPADASGDNSDAAGEMLYEIEFPELDKSEMKLPLAQRSRMMSLKAICFDIP